MDRSTEYYSSSGRWGFSPQLELQYPQLPPGFRFHPTDEELVVHYLRKKAASAPLPVAIIADVDLYKFDPWELPGKASFGEEEWYFFSPRERKYPNGARPNRAATSGYWKATGTDKPILASGGTSQKVGVKKALVFYGGKPPKGVKTNWIMHEYRLSISDCSGGSSSSSKINSTTSTPPPPPGGVDAAAASSCKTKSSSRLDDWVLCRIYQKKSSGNVQRQETDGVTDQADNMSPPVPHELLRRPTSRVVLQLQPHMSTDDRYYGSDDTTNICGARHLDCNDENFFELGLLAAGSVQLQVNRPSPHVADLNGSELSMLLPAGSVGSALVLPLKRGLSNSATSWNEAGAPAIVASPAGKRVHSCSSDVSGTVNSVDGEITHLTNEDDNNGYSAGGNEGSPSMMATLLDHLQRQGAPYHHQYSAVLSAIGDGVFRQPYDQLHAPDRFR